MSNLTVYDSSSLRLPLLLAEQTPVKAAVMAGEKLGEKTQYLLIKHY